MAEISDHQKDQESIADMLGQGEAVRFANRLSQDLYPDESLMKRGDALRHMLWQGKLQQQYGTPLAILAGWAHELGGAVDGQNADERDMDIINNRIGRQLGRESTNDSDLVGKALQEIVNKRAKHYADGGSVNTDSTNSAVEDYKQLLDAYPNAKKFLASLGANVEKIVPSANDIKDPNKMMDVALNFGPSNLASGLAGVIKQKGGNWLEGIYSPESSVDRLKTKGPVLPQYELAKDSLNDWLDQKLAKYVRNEMGTPEDPIRALAEKGILHVAPEQIMDVGYSAKSNRYFAGMPQENTALSDLAKKWEDAVDSNITGTKVKDLGPTTLSDNPWTAKLSPEDVIHSSNVLRGVGFEHLRDELQNAIRHDSDLPEALRLDPSKLNKVSVPQAVERVAKINEWRAAQKAEANAALARNPATHLHKDYPEQGLSWVELKQPNEASDTSALANALKYEGDVMGHCVGGYCPDVVSGRSRIFSLRDAKGEPHVTIETGPSITGDLREDIDEVFNHMTPNQARKFNEWLDEDFDGDFGSAEEWMQQNTPGAYKKWLNAVKNSGEMIHQIKGKGNKAPAEKYLPAVQDFVRSGKWSDVGDIQNTGFNSLDELMKGYADGGSVEFDPDHIQSIIDEFHQGEYGLRPDETEKGRGYLNELKRPDGAVMTEYSIGMPINGVEMDVPTLVPNLTIDEIKSILSMPERGKIPSSIVQKAAEHAEKRVKAGKSVFATPEESEFGER